MLCLGCGVLGQCTLGFNGCSRWIQLSLVAAYGIPDVLDMVLAIVRERHGQIAPYGGIHRVREDDLAWFGKALQPGSNVDAVSVGGAVCLFDQVSKVQADTKLHDPAG